MARPGSVVAVAIGAMYGSRKTGPPLAVTVRDRLGEWLRDGEFAAAFGSAGPGWPPSRLALVTALQRAENLTDRMAAEAVRTRLDWKYLLGLPLEDPGSGHWLLPEFRAKAADAGLEQAPPDIYAGGREVVKRREKKQPEGDGIPPGRHRIASPYDTGAAGAPSETRDGPVTSCTSPGPATTPGPAAAPATATTGTAMRPRSRTWSPSQPPPAPRSPAWR